MNITPGNYIRFSYRELVSDRKGNTRIEVNEYSGYVTEVFKNGQFVVADSGGGSKMRFERIAIVEN